MLYGIDMESDFKKWAHLLPQRQTDEQKQWYRGRACWSSIRRMLALWTGLSALRSERTKLCGWISEVFFKMSAEHLFMAETTWAAERRCKKSCWVSCMEEFRLSFRTCLAEPCGQKQKRPVASLRQAALVANPHWFHQPGCSQSLPSPLSSELV